jgi:hypothetical protein
MVRAHRAGDPDDIGGACDPMYGDTMPEPDRLVALVRVAIDAARAGQFIDYGVDISFDYGDGVRDITDAYATAYRATYGSPNRPVLHPSVVQRIRDGEQIVNVETGE